MSPLIDPGIGARSSRLLHAGRSSLGAVLCGLEAIVSTIVFAYTINKVSEFAVGSAGTDTGKWKAIQALFPGWMMIADFDNPGFLPLPPVLIFTGCAIWTGISHTFFCTWKRRGESTPTNDEVSRLERERLSESVDLDGVDLFDYREIVGFSLDACKGFSMWVFYQLFSFLFTCAWIMLLVVNFSFGSRVELTAGLALAFALWLSGCTCVLLRKFGFISRFRKLGQACRTQPRSYAVKGLLMESGVWYAAVLYVSPAPAVWRWSLAVTHIARSLKLLHSLRGRGEVALGAGGEVEDVGEVVVDMV